MGPKSWSNMVQPSQARLEKSSAKQSGSKIKHVKPIRVGVRAQKGLRAPDTWLADQNYSRGDHTWPYCTIQHQIERHMHKRMQCTLGNSSNLLGDCPASYVWLLEGTSPKSCAKAFFAAFFAVHLAWGQSPGMSAEWRRSNPLESSPQPSWMMAPDRIIALISMTTSGTPLEVLYHLRL